MSDSPQEHEVVRCADAVVELEKLLWVLTTSVLGMFQLDLIALARPRHNNMIEVDSVYNCLRRRVSPH